jgi:hypothetical protein
MAADPSFIYWRLKQGQADKIGQRTAGLIHYEVLTNKAKNQLWLRITANDSGGFFSKECISMEVTKTCLKGIPRTQPFLSKQLAFAFKGRSSNNAGFLAAILRAEGLLGPVPDHPFMHLQQGQWEPWVQSLLKGEGEMIDLTPQPKEPSAKQKKSAPTIEPAATEEIAQGEVAQ